MKLEFKPQRKATRCKSAQIDLSYFVIFTGKRGVRYQGTMNKAIYEGTRRRSPQLVSFLKKGNEPVFEMIKKVKEKEKMERAAIMEEKMKRNFLEGKSKLHRLGLVDKRQNDGQQGPFIEAEGQQELFIEDGSEEK